MLHVVSVSGGKDSTATYCKALELGVPFRAVAADTGNEHPATYEAVNRLHEKTGGPRVEWVKADFSNRIAGKRRFIERNWEAHGVPADLVARALAVLHPTGNPFLDLCLWKGRFPSRKAQFCTFELKVQPIDRHVTRSMMATGETVISWQGARAAESIVRRNLPAFQRLAVHDDFPGRLFVFRPLLRVVSVEEVFAIARRHGVEPNPLYGWGLSRVGCFPCINCTKNELALVDRVFPEQIDRLEERERFVSDASKQGHMSFFTLVNGPVMAAEWAIFKASGGNAARGRDEARNDIARFTLWNKFAYQAQDVRELRTAADPVGPQNDAWIRRAIEESDICIVAWGPLSKLPTRLRGRWREVVEIAADVGRPLQCFGTALDGHPLHPLTLGYVNALRPWSPPS